MIVIGSRGSDLALWQATHVQALLAARAGLAAEIRIIQTAGDRIQDVQLASLDGKGFFTKEIEAALLAGEIDLAVHSHKDLPTDSPPGLAVGAVPERGPVAECLLVRDEAWDPAAPALPLRAGAVVGTGSLRRSSQLLARRPDLRIEDLRGNVPTRLRKAGEGRYDAIVLAHAGLTRLGLDPAPLRLHLGPPAEVVPAPAQGALAVQIRAGAARRPQDAAVAAAVARLHDAPTARAVAAERLLLAACEGGCNLPLGAWAVLAGDAIVLTATLGQPDGTVRRCAVRAADPAAAARLAHRELTA
ncbi:MAG: hydroxymethylbilane synthase [Candidatus Krumholzibacteriia bacterium]